MSDPTIFKIKQVKIRTLDMLQNTMPSRTSMRRFGNTVMKTTFNHERSTRILMIFM